MKRRDFIKALGLLGATYSATNYIPGTGLIKPAFAGSISKRNLINARAIVRDSINFVRPATMPTIINVFMYGGPSELGGNLTNINEINTRSLNKYNTNLLTPFETVNTPNGEITPNGFWRNAGGQTMENMITAQQMTVFRTINRVKDDSKAHRTSIFSAQVGGLSEMAPGIGSTLAAVLQTFLPEEYDNPDNLPILPFITFESDPVMYNIGDLDELPLWLRAVSLDSAFANPYQRRRLGPLVNAQCNGGSCDNLLEQLAARTADTSRLSTNYDRTTKSFTKRLEMDAFFSGGGLSSTLNRDLGVTFQGSFGNTLKAAVVLALTNPDTRFMTLGTGGLGGWDDHNGAVDRYAQRMTGLMDNLQAAANLLRDGVPAIADDPLTTTVDETAAAIPGRNDVVINVFGEFGRNANLNGSEGWDHGNNMNLYTFGGSGIPSRIGLGQVLGTTSVIEPSRDRLFTTPASGSPQWEPFSIASSVYKYFGIQNPEELTKDDDMAPEGFPTLET